MGMKDSGRSAAALTLDCNRITAALVNTPHRRSQRAPSSINPRFVIWAKHLLSAWSG